MAIDSITIYKVTLNDVIKYIGITSKPLSYRIKSHYYSAFKKKSTYKFHNAIRKYKDNLKFEIIETVNTWEQAVEKEKQYIQLYNTFLTYGGYNSTLGGDGSYGLKFSEESRKRVSESLKKRTWKRLNYKHSLETRKKLRDSHLGKLNNGMSRKVKDENGTIFQSMADASRKTGIKHSNIKESCRLNRKMRNGKQFFYVTEEPWQ